jgi:hypothetical protein
MPVKWIDSDERSVALVGPRKLMLMVVRRARIVLDCPRYADYEEWDLYFNENMVGGIDYESPTRERAKANLVAYAREPLTATLKELDWLKEQR